MTYTDEDYKSDFTGTSQPPRVRFGHRDDDTMPLSWAENGLEWLRSERPQVFADMMLAILGIEKKRRSSSQ
jgi:hypothetical protein